MALTLVKLFVKPLVCSSGHEAKLSPLVQYENVIYQRDWIYTNKTQNAS